MMGGWMMAGCVLLGVLPIILLVLAVSALIKYLRESKRAIRDMHIHWTCLRAS